jgi:hypothetical protein
MPTLCAASEKPFGPVWVNGLEAVKAAVRILQRHDQMTTGIAAQTERHDLFADEIKMIGGSRASGGPGTGGAEGGLICPGGWCGFGGNVG